MDILEREKKEKRKERRGFNTCFVSANCTTGYMIVYLLEEEVEGGIGRLPRSTLSPFSTLSPSLSLSVVPGLPLKKEGWLADNELMYDPVTSPTRQPPSPSTLE